MIPHPLIRLLIRFFAALALAAALTLAGTTASQAGDSCPCNDPDDLTGPALQNVCEALGSWASRLKTSRRGKTR